LAALVGAGAAVVVALVTGAPPVVAADGTAGAVVGRTGPGPEEGVPTEGGEKVADGPATEAEAEAEAEAERETDMMV